MDCSPPPRSSEEPYRTLAALPISSLAASTSSPSSLAAYAPFVMQWWRREIGVTLLCPLDFVLQTNASECYELGSFDECGGGSAMDVWFVRIFN